MGSPIPPLFMKTLLSYIGIVVITVALTWLWKDFTTPEREHAKVVTDTVFVDVPYKVETYQEWYEPVEVVFYPSDFEQIDHVRVERDTVYFETDDNIYLYNSEFLTMYPLTPRFLALDIIGDKLTFTGQQVSGLTQTSRWEYDPEFSYSLRPNGDGWIALDRTRRPRNRFQFRQQINLGYMVYPTVEPFVGHSSRFDVFGGLSLRSTIQLSENHTNASVGLSYDL